MGGGVGSSSRSSSSSSSSSNKGGRGGGRGGGSRASGGGIAAGASLGGAGGGVGVGVGGGKREADAAFLAAAYSLALNACPAWAWETALRLWERMRAAGVPPDAQAARSMLRALRRGARWRESVGCLRALEASDGPGLSDMDRSELLGIVTGACENAGAWQPALEAQRRLPRAERSRRKERAPALARLAEEAEQGVATIRVAGTAAEAAFLASPRDGDGSDGDGSEDGDSEEAKDVASGFGEDVASTDGGGQGGITPETSPPLAAPFPPPSRHRAA